MTTAAPTNVNNGGGGCPAGGNTATCCLARTGSHEVAGRRFDRVFQKFGRSTAWCTNDPVSAANLPSGVTWEAFYYVATYSYLLAYNTTAAAPGGKFDGTLTVTLRCKATVHATSPALLAAAPTLFTAVTPADITAAFGPWNAAVQTHWTNRRYTVEIGAPDCPGKFTMSFSAVEAASGNHITFSVLNMQYPSAAPWAAAAANPADPLHPTALRLQQEWRSNAAKFNLGDTRGPLVFAHEYGHWMGWGDEYIEITGRNLPHPTNPTGGLVLYEARNGAHQSLRTAIRIKNPTRNFHSAHGTDLEDIDITVPGHEHWLMANMADAQTYQPRFVYTIVHDFIEFYNKDHYGGGSTAYCVDVTVS